MVGSVQLLKNQHMLKNQHEIVKGYGESGKRFSGVFSLFGSPS